MKLLVLAAATLLALTVFAVPSPGTSSAQIADTCGNQVINVPDFVDGLFNFSDACLNHDICYANVESPLDRQQCDRQFFSDMLASCNLYWGDDEAGRRSCYGVALLYYLGVRAGGGFFLAFSFNTNPL